MNHKNPSATVLQEGLILLIMEYAKENFLVKPMKKKGKIKSKMQRNPMVFDKGSNTMTNDDDEDQMDSKGGMDSVVALSSFSLASGGKKKRKAPSKKALTKKSPRKVLSSSDWSQTRDEDDGGSVQRKGNLEGLRGDDVKGKEKVGEDMTQVQKEARNGS